MDSVRFGRVLGIGARHAAKTLVTAVDAATAPNPSGERASGTAAVNQSRSSFASSATAARRAGQRTARTAAEVRGTSRGIARGTRRFGEAAWGPFARLSGVLWLELTGVFFGLFAFSAAVGAWKLRDSWHSRSESRTHLELAISFACVFGYFCISSFVRARRRERRP